MIGAATRQSARKPGRTGSRVKHRVDKTGNMAHTARHRENKNQDLKVLGRIMAALAPRSHICVLASP